jgi:hypothetical protein
MQAGRQTLLPSHLPPPTLHIITTTSSTTSTATTTPPQPPPPARRSRTAATTSNCSACSLATAGTRPRCAVSARPSRTAPRPAPALRPAGLAKCATRWRLMPSTLRVRVVMVMWGSPLVPRWLVRKDPRAQLFTPASSVVPAVPISMCDLPVSCISLACGLRVGCALRPLCALLPSCLLLGGRSFRLVMVSFNDLLSSNIGALGGVSNTLEDLQDRDIAGGSSTCVGSPRQKT